MKSSEKEPVLVSWRGGKDSALALNEILKHGIHRVAALVTTVTADYDRISMHGVRRVLLEQQAASLGLPLEEVLILSNASNEQLNRGVRKMGNLARAIVYYCLSVVLFPVTLIGYVTWIGKILVSGRRSGVSSTAQAPLVGRWGLHKLGKRPDEASSRLLMVLPGISPLAVHLTSASVRFGFRVTGYVPALYRYPYEGDIPPQAEAAGRMAFFDRVVERYLPAITQFVILGAGFDTRAFRLPSRSGVRSFEVDAPRTQAIKCEALRKAGIDTSGVTFVSADFEKEDWLAKLIAAGFDPGKPALFVWEGVTMYLDGPAVEAALHKIAGTAKGSIVAFDYFTDESLLSRSFYWRFARATTKSAGEPLKFGIDSTPPAKERLSEFLRSKGLELRDYHMLGHETEGTRAWGGFAVASV